MPTDKSLLFSRLNWHSHLSLSSYVSSFILSSSLWPFFGSSPVCSCLQGTQDQTRTPDVTLLGLSKGEGSLLAYFSAWTTQIWSWWSWNIKSGLLWVPLPPQASLFPLWAWCSWGHLFFAFSITWVMIRDLQEAPWLLPLYYPSILCYIWV